MIPTDEQVAILALTKAATGLHVKWHRAATLADQAGSAVRILRGDWNGFEPFDVEEAEQLAGAVTQSVLDECNEIVVVAEKSGAKLITILDPDYPENLRRVYNRPPFLFVRGELKETDTWAVAVVGTRRASEDGLSQASRLANDLVTNGVTVLSGLALGIDAAAHTAALEARGRTIAVMGTGIERVYPRQNEPLAARILNEGGALVSQFWPDAPPTPYSFPMRNAVMSGMAIGTVVVEANSRSGARMQARLALEHGKRLFLFESLVMQEEWAQRYARSPATQVVDSVDDVLEVLGSVEAPIEQLTLG